MTKKTKALYVTLLVIFGILGTAASIYLWINGAFMVIWSIVGAVWSIVHDKATWAGYFTYLIKVLAAYGVYRFSYDIAKRIGDKLKAETSCEDSCQD